MGLAHWDEVAPSRRAKGAMDATWQPLGATAGADGVGVNRVRVAAGMLPTPPHSHGASEELYYVLGGSGLAWQDEVCHEIGPGDCVAHRADEHEHTFRAGSVGLDLLVFGTNHPTEYGWLPRSGAIRLSWPWVAGRTDDPWDVEAQAEPLQFGEPSPRPPNIVNLDAVEGDGEDGIVWKGLAAAAGARTTGLNWLHLPEGRIGAPPHCHSEEEEVFVVLEGAGTLELWPSPVAESRGIAREDVSVRAGHVVARPPATKVAHAFRGGAGGLTLLLYGTRRPNDIAYYPRSGKVWFGGIGLITRVESLGFADGEPDD